MRNPVLFRARNRLSVLIWKPILLDNKLCRHPFCLQASASSVRKKPSRGSETPHSGVYLYSLVRERRNIPDSSGANVTVASSLLHLAASRFHFPGARIFHSEMCSEGNLKIIQRKVEFYGEYKRQVMSYLCEREPAKRCKIITVTQATPFFALGRTCDPCSNVLRILLAYSYMLETKRFSAPCTFIP